MSDSTRNTEDGAVRTLWTPEPVETADALDSRNPVEAGDSIESIDSTEFAALPDPVAGVEEPERVDLAAIREKLANAKGPELWRGRRDRWRG